MTLPNAPVCPYCGAKAVFHSTSAHVYRRDYGPIWACDPCAAWVGCHPGTRKPLGRLADKALRDAKIRAHAAFDPLWKAKIKRDQCSKGEARSKGYAWLSQQLGIPPRDTHIGMFDAALCARVVELCQSVRRTA